ELFGSLPILAGNTLKLQYSASLHDQNSAYGTTIYNARQWIAFAQLLYDRNLNLRHDLLLGLSYRYSWFDDNTAATREFTGNENKPDIILLPGIFMQHNWKISSRHTLLSGIRYDLNSLHGSILTPRINYKYMPNQYNTFRLGLGSGYRVANIFTEDHA